MNDMNTSALFGLVTCKMAPVMVVTSQLGATSISRNFCPRKNIFK